VNVLVFAAVSWNRAIAGEKLAAQVVFAWAPLTLAVDLKVTLF
jgi:hypothetical protein